jgi:hypothetical protein
MTSEIAALQWQRSGAERALLVTSGLPAGQYDRIEKPLISRHEIRYPACHYRRNMPAWHKEEYDAKSPER